jgi:IclR family transcriptional regulator, pca regulon regulatory protein
VSGSLLPAPDVDRDADFVQSLQRGLAVIQAFATAEPALTLGEVAAATGLARAATRRFLLTLVALGYVRDEGRLYRLSPRVLELGRAYLSSLRLPELALPHLRALVDDVHESSTIAVLDGMEIVYVAHVPARRIMSITISVGTRDPAFATSLGRALLAGQPDEALDGYVGSVDLPAMTPRTLADPRHLRAELVKIRKKGFALVDQELEDGLRAIAAPLRDADGRVVAAVNLAVHASRWTLDAIRRELVPRLLATAGAIERELATSLVAQSHKADDAPGPPAVAGRDGDFVQSLERGLGVIRAFDGQRASLTLSDVAKATGLTRAAARRFLLTLVELGYMTAEGRLFRLSPRVLDLGRPYLSSLTLQEVAQPHLGSLVGRVEESATVAVLDGAEIVYVAHAPARRILSVSVGIGTRDPAFATSLGRVLLAGQGDDWLDGYLASVKLQKITPRTIATPARLRAELERVRQQGFALVDQELEEGLRAIAAPIHDNHGRVIAAVNLAVHASRWSLREIEAGLVPSLLATAADIQRDVRASV